MPPNRKNNEMFTHLRENTQAYELAVVFGSYARGEAYRSSDLDLLLIDDKFSGWSVYEDSQAILEWPDEFPKLHLIVCSPGEFETRYKNNEEMVNEIAEDGFAVNESFGLVDYIRNF